MDIIYLFNIIGMKGCFTSLSTHQGSNLQRNEMKDDSPFRHRLVGYEHMLASGLRFHGLQRKL